MATSNELCAHTPPEHDPLRWHGLREHLEAVSQLAGSFARKFGAEEFGRALGLAHDLAKADPRFQAYLRACHEGRKSEKCPHAAPSAAAVEGILQASVFAIVGHHVGLRDRNDVREALLGADPQSVVSAKAMWEQLTASIPVKPKLPSTTSSRAAEFLLRMLFSCLVDADYLDTELHFDRVKPLERGAFSRCDRDNAVEMARLRDLLAERMSQFARATGVVNEVRAEVLNDCQAAAMDGRGVFRLTVPTGGGKTLSSLNFALQHAVHHGLDRVIFAIPYTSIIDQTADVYETMLGKNVVLEHHSAIDTNDEVEGQTPAELRRRLAAENWDARIIVTTTVQLFESLFAARPSRCRKLHNIANSVIVLDEVQTLPCPLLEPILDALAQLVESYGCTVVFCTATQPDYTSLKSKLSARCYDLISGATEITRDPARHFQTLRRVEYAWEPKPISDEALAARICREPQVLCVLNTRKDAVRVLKACGQAPALFHLSTLMCPDHRKRVLREVRARLASGQQVRLVSTQVVEAGVDLDFPVVMRDLGPLDRIVQAAGRCNREGKLPGRGRCVIFELERASAPRGGYLTGQHLTRTSIREAIDRLDQPDAIAEYFRDLYALTDTDAKRIQQKREDLRFETVARDFRMIPDDTTTMLVAEYEPKKDPDAVRRLLADYRYQSPLGWMRAVRPYCVAVPNYEALKFRAAGLLTDHESGLPMYVGPYHKTYGIGSGEERDPADLIA